MFGTLIFSGLARAAQQAALLLFLIATVRWLGLEGRGALAAAIAWSQCLGAVAHLSLGQVAYRRLGVGAPVLAVARAGGDLALVAVAGGVACGGVLAAIFAWFGPTAFGGLSSQMVTLIAVGAFLVIADSYVLYLASAGGALNVYNLALILGRVLALAAAWCAAEVFKWGPEGAFGGYLAGQAASIGLATLRVHVDFRAEGRVSTLRSWMADVLKLHPTAMAAMVFGSVDVLLVHAFAGDRPAALYNIAFVMLSVFVLPAQAVAQTMYQKIAELGPDRAWPAQQRLIAAMGGAALLAGGLAWLAAPDALAWLLGQDSRAAGDLFRVIWPLGAAMFVSTALAPQWVARGAFVGLSATVVAAAAVLLTLDAVLAPRLGLSGAAWGANAAAGVWIAGNLIMVARLRRAGLTAAPG